MKRTLLLVLALAVIPTGIDAQVTPSTSCADIKGLSPLEDLRSCGEQGYAQAQYYLGAMYATGTGVPEDKAEAVRWYRLAAEACMAEHQVTVLLRAESDASNLPDDPRIGRFFYRLLDDPGLAGRLRDSGCEVMVHAGWKGVGNGDHAQAFQVSENLPTSLKSVELAAQAGCRQPMDTLRDKALLEELWKQQQAPWKVW